MPRPNRYDNMMKGKSLKDLQALKTCVDARLKDFIACKNEAQATTYKSIQAALDKAIAAYQS